MEGKVNEFIHEFLSRSLLSLNTVTPTPSRQLDRLLSWPESSTEGQHRLPQASDVPC